MPPHLTNLVSMADVINNNRWRSSDSNREDGPDSNTWSVVQGTPNMKYNASEKNIWKTKEDNPRQLELDKVNLFDPELNIRRKLTQQEMNQILTVYEKKSDEEFKNAISELEISPEYNLMIPHPLNGGTRRSRRKKRASRKRCRRSRRSRKHRKTKTLQKSV